MKKITSVIVLSSRQLPGNKIRRTCSKCKSKRYLENLRVCECGKNYVCKSSRGYFSSVGCY